MVNYYEVIEEDRMIRIALLLILVGFTQSACIAVGYSSRGGWFFWPGGLGLILVLAVLFLLLRGRR